MLACAFELALAEGDVLLTYRTVMQGSNEQKA